MTEIPLILASKSHARSQILKDAGLDFEIVASNVDEDSLKLAMRAEGASVRDQVMLLAEAKSAKVSERHQGLVIGADQMMSFKGQALDKPASLNEARDRLREMRGEPHTLENGVVICEGGRSVWRYTNSVKLTMRSFSDAFLDEYLERAGDQVLESVGAYQLESLGIQLFSKVEGDYFSVLGLPILPVLDYLRTRGVVPS